MHTAVHGRFVVDTGTGSHHHSSSDGINGVRGQTGRDGDRVTEHESEQEGWIFTEQGLDGVVQTEVKTSIDEDTDGGDDETSVKTGNTIGGNGLSVDIDQTVKLSLTVLALSIVSHSGSGKVQRVDKQQRQSTSATTRSDVSHGLDEVRRFFGDRKDCFELFLESKVQGLSWEVSQDVGQVTSPERTNTFFSQDSLGAVDDTGVGFVKSALFDHFVLVLDQELDSFDGSGGGFGDTSGHTGKHEIFEESDFLFGSHCSCEKTGFLKVKMKLKKYDEGLLYLHALFLPSIVLAFLFQTAKQKYQCKNIELQIFLEYYICTMCLILFLYNSMRIAYRNYFLRSSVKFLYFTIPSLFHFHEN